MAGELERLLMRAMMPVGGRDSMQQLQTLQEAVAEALRKTSRVIPVSTAERAEKGSGGGGSRTGVFGPGLLLSPLISGVMKLFGGGGGTPEPPLVVRFALPPPAHVNAGVSRGVAGVFGVDSAQGWTSRPVMRAAVPQIQVQVQAMDSQSFLDRSGDIARAVRQAMLESGVLSDVIREA
jgi:hypothetical protein